MRSSRQSKPIVNPGKGNPDSFAIRNPGDGMIFGDKVLLREKRSSDAHNDYLWQTDQELVELDASPVLTMPFSHYLLEYALQLRSSALIRRPFAVETFDGKHIGNCSYYNVEEAKGEAEVGIMIGDRDYWDKGYGTDAITALVSHIFEGTRLKRLYLKTLDWNKRAQQCFNKCGFTPCGQLYQNGYNFVLMELHRKGWEKLHGKT